MPVLLLASCTPSEKGVSWSYVLVDSTKQKWGDWDNPEWLRYFGLDHGDINNDGLQDIISGRYVYHNPGGESQNWRRTVLDDNVDAILHVDVDGDPYFDFIAQALPHLYWYEAVNKSGTAFKRQQIAQIPATTHVNSQGFEKADIMAGGPQELLIAGNGNIYAVTIPDQPNSRPWPTHLIAANTSDEGIGVGDVDGDGDLDLAAGRRPDGEDEPTILVWFENPGTLSSQWTAYPVGATSHSIDRVGIADLTGDGQAEIIITEERYPGLEPDANLYWFSFDSNPHNQWERHQIAQQYSSNNLDLADIDNDGDIDLLTAEHKGPQLEVQLWINDGQANFQKTVISTGKENHLGTQFVDIDGDGDLDIIGATWDNYQNVHLWRNESQQPANAQHAVMVDMSQIQLDTSKYEYEDRPHYVIRTNALTYYYDIAGGGFSRIIDKLGNDWVHYKNEPWGEYPASAASSFRGLPNLVWQGTDDGAGHPGHNQCTTRIVDNKLVTESKSKMWKWTWEFFDQYAKLEIVKSDPSRKYWFLYEGTPGGKFAPESTYFGTSLGGPQQEQYDYYLDQQLYSKYFSWMYAGAESQDMVFFMVHLEQDEQLDLISTLGNTNKGIQSDDGMTVWGFGRDPETKPLLSGPQSFIIGAYPAAIKNTQDHAEFSHYIEQTFYQP